jgi:isopenicillin N synthase-like dioxygenase
MTPPPHQNEELPFELTPGTFGEEVAQESLPIIDVAGLLALNQIHDAKDVPAELRELCGQIGSALEEWGFFVAAPGHGVKGLREIEDVGRRFFALPTEKKLAYDMNKNATYRGYSHIGGEVTEGRKDFKAVMDMGTDHPDNRGLNTFLGANQYVPDSVVPGFKRATDLYHNGMKGFGEAVVRAIAVHLGLPIDAMVTKQGETENHLYRMISYPPKPATVPAAAAGSASASAPAAADSAPVNALGAHYDYGLSAMITTTGPGLEVLSNSGKWVKAPYIPGSIIYNSGDMATVYTNGRIKSTLHRVTHNNNFQRLSFPFFYEPNYDAVVAPLGLCGKDKVLYEPVSYADHVRDGTSKSFANHRFSKLWALEKEAKRMAQLREAEDEAEADVSTVRDDDSVSDDGSSSGSIATSEAPASPRDTTSGRMIMADSPAPGTRPSAISL